MFSVVIACRNDAKRLETCLQALAESTYRIEECIVVDDASTDGSAGVAKEHGAEVVVCGIRGGPAKARNIGARRAKGDVLLFLDADVRIHSDAIQRLAEHFAVDPALDAVIGSYDESPAHPSFLSQYRNLLHCFTHQQGCREASTFWCGCGAVRRSSFWSLGGLPEHYDRPSIEDIDFGHRLVAAGGRVLLDPDVQVQHLKLWTFAGMLRTDIFDRGIPWTRLILSSRGMPDDLSVRWNQRASVALVFAAILAIATGHPLIAMFPALAVAAVNYRFYGFLIARRGLWFAVRALPLHFLYFLYSGVAFGLGVAGHLMATFRGTPVPAIKSSVE